MLGIMATWLGCSSNNAVVETRRLKCDADFLTTTRRRIAIALSVALVASGCQVTPTEEIAIGPIPRAELASVERIGVGASADCRAASGQLPDVVEGAGEGALRGAGEGAMAGLYPLVALGQAGPIGMLIGAALCVVTVPLGLIIGTTAGAASAHSPEEVAAAQSDMLAALEEVDPLSTLLARIAETGNFRTLSRFVICDPAAPGADCTTATSGVGALVEVKSLQVAFISNEQGFGERWSPDLTPFVIVTAAVLTGAGKQELFHGSWRYRGKLVDFFDLADNGARKFTLEVLRAIDAIGDAIVADAFIGPEKVLSNRPLPPTQQIPETVALFRSSFTEVQAP
jgi:hypothetical protein